MNDEVAFYSERGAQYRMTVKYGMHKIGEQEPYFSITADVDRKTKNGRWVEDMGGCLHDEIIKHKPSLEPLIKWHLCDQSSLPMHYAANAGYWYEKMNGCSRWDNKYDPDPMKAFKNTVVWREGVDVMPGLPFFESGLVPKLRRAAVKTMIDEWCAARFLDIQKAFHEDMTRFNIEYIN